jgi:gliding motility-associated-like protein
MAQINSSSNVLCPGTAIVLNGSGDGSYLWSTSATSALISTSAPGTYILTVTNACGIDSDAIVITQSNINVAFTQDVTSGSAPLTVSFDNNSIGTNSYAWSFGDDESSSATSPQHIFSHGGVYQVVLIGTDASGCADSAKVTITVEDIEQPIPNIITPNEDSKNDYFHIISTRIKSADIKIYNRWGRIIADFTDWKSGWDAKDASAGTYYFIVQLQYFDGSAKTEKGVLTIIR